ncbi:MAG: hypothetical protein COA78_05945 [Blastopirellula sp.]|nr:MAG: hypothetical protein COA78_05945 [Blastopirellula sp.]
MSNVSTAKLSVRTIDLPADTATVILKSQFRQAKSDCTIIFVIFTFVGLGISGFMRMFVFSDPSPLLSLGIALTCGSFAALCMLGISFLDWPLVRKDLDAGVCLEAEIIASRSIAVRFPQNSLSAIALDCGDDTVVLLGEWWLNETQIDIWGTQKIRKDFPSTHFSIRYLPISGKVLSVNISGKKLRTEESETSEPILDLDFSKYAEIVHVNNPLDAIMHKREVL